MQETGSKFSLLPVKKSHIITGILHNNNRMVTLNHDARPKSKVADVAPAQPIARLKAGNQSEVWTAVVAAHYHVGAVVFGRQPQNLPGVHLTLEGDLGGERISRTHGQLYWTADGMYYQDLGANPSKLKRLGHTFQTEIPKGGQVRLWSGDTIYLPDGIQLTVPTETEIAKSALKLLHGRKTTERSDYEELGNRICQLSKDTKSSSSALNLLAEAAIKSITTPRDPEQLRFLNSLKGRNEDFAVLLQQRRFPSDAGNSVCGYLGLSSKLSGARIFKEEKGEILSVLGIAPSPKSTTLPPLNVVESPDGNYEFARVPLARFTVGGNVRHILTQGSLTSCVHSASFLLTLDACYRSKLAPAALNKIARGVWNSSISDHEAAYSSLAKSLDGSGLQPTQATCPKDLTPNGLKKILEAGPAMIHIATAVGGHVILLDSVKTGLFRPATVSIRDTYHGWSIEIPWQTLQSFWTGKRTILQISESNSR
jgi:hypothetical protein